MAAAFGAGRGDDAIRWLDDALAAEDRIEVERPSALVHACYLGGGEFGDRIDLYDVRAAPAAPRTEPWLHGADLP